MYRLSERLSSSKRPRSKRKKFFALPLIFSQRRNLLAGVEIMTTLFERVFRQSTSASTSRNVLTKFFWIFNNSDLLLHSGVRAYYECWHFLTGSDRICSFGICNCTYIEAFLSSCSGLSVFHFSGYLC